MRLTIRQLQIFVAVAKRGSTTAAAVDIALSQSATSAALNELEALLGTRLFDRVGKRLVINDYGRGLLPQARFVVDGANAIEANTRDPSGAAAPRLLIGASTTIGNYVLPDVIARFLKSRPDRQIDLDIGNTGEIASAVARFEVDIGFIEGPCHEQRLTITPWMQDELVIVCSPRHELARIKGARKVRTADLRQAEWLLREPGSGTREAVEQGLLPHLYQLRSRVQLGGAHAIKVAAAAGLGLACMSRRVVDDFVALGRLTILDTTLPPLRRTFNLIHHEQKYISPGLAAFIAHCRAIKAK